MAFLRIDESGASLDAMAAFEQGELEQKSPANYPSWQGMSLRSVGHLTATENNCADQT
jgi:hypothetical protein